MVIHDGKNWSSHQGFYCVSGLRQACFSSWPSNIHYMAKDEAERVITELSSPPASERPFWHLVVKFDVSIVNFFQIWRPGCPGFEVVVLLRLCWRHTFATQMLCHFKDFILRAGVLSSYVAAIDANKWRVPRPPPLAHPPSPPPAGGGIHTSWSYLNKIL